jgi:hypothetical protein
MYSSTALSDNLAARLFVLSSCVVVLDVIALIRFVYSTDSWGCHGNSGVCAHSSGFSLCAVVFLVLALLWV